MHEVAACEEACMSRPLGEAATRGKREPSWHCAADAWLEVEAKRGAAGVRSSREKRKACKLRCMLRLGAWVCRWVKLAWSGARRCDYGRCKWANNFAGMVESMQGSSGSRRMGSHVRVWAV